MGILKKILLVIICLLSLVSTGYAACSGSSPNWACDTTKCPTQDELTACITGATSGDTITYAAGTYTWTAYASIPEAKTIILVGAGSGVGGTELVNATTGRFIVSRSPNSKISGFHFHDTTTVSNSILEIANTGWRIYNNKITGNTTGSPECVTATGSNVSMMPQGLIDGNTMIDCRIGVFGMGTAAKQYDEWYAAYTFGTINSVYIENNSISRTTGYARYAIDGDSSGNFVFRYNDVTTLTATHGLRVYSGSAIRAWEVYNNKWDYPDSTWKYIFWARGGSGYIYNNVVNSGSRTDYFISFDNQRSVPGGAYYMAYNGFQVPPTFASDAGICNGSSPWDGNESINLSAVYGDTGTGTVAAGKGDATGTTLTDDAKAWTADSFFITSQAHSPTGNNDGSVEGNNTVLTKKTGTNWTASELLGMLLRNTTDGSTCVITANTTTTATCSGGLLGGSDNLWQENDAYSIIAGITIWNTTTGEHGIIWDNDVTHVYHQKLASGWSVGDGYKITDGYPCRNQIGTGTDSALFSPSTLTFPAPAKLPTYIWNNTDVEGDQITVEVIPFGRWIAENRDYYVCTTQAECETDHGMSYARYQCPHEYVGTGTCSATAGTAGYSISGGGTTYTVTVSHGANNTIYPDSNQTIDTGETTVFTIGWDAGYRPYVGGTCGGTLSNSTYTTSAITADCTVISGATAQPTLRTSAGPTFRTTAGPTVFAQ